MQLPYRDYAAYLAERFPWKMQKLTINAGFSCPNRDGTIGTGGCSYCNNASFSPNFKTTAETDSIKGQLEAGKRFFAKKYPTMRYLAYFQSYTNTHGSSVKRLRRMYEEALEVEGVEGIIIGTRPDCINEEILNELSSINASHRVIMEYGAESSHDTTLAAVNRCHSWETTIRAVEMTRKAGLDVGLHFIMGLPGESREMMLKTIDRINFVAPDTVKFHQLQVIKGTRLATQMANREISLSLFDIESYIDLCCEIVMRLSPTIAIERFTSSAPADLVIAPRWGIKNYEFTHRLINKLQSAQT